MGRAGFQTDHSTARADMLPHPLKKREKLVGKRNKKNSKKNLGF